MSAEQCRYMAAAYPILTGEESCSQHRHDEATFALARAMAVAFQNPFPTDEQIGWCLDDAAAVVDDFDPVPDAWSVSEPELTDEPGLEFTLTINARAYVIQPSEWAPSHPVSRAQWEAWQDEDCDHDWEVRPESDTRVVRVVRGGPVIRRLALAAINTAAAAAEWLLDTHLDQRVCRLSRDLSGDDDD